MSTGANSQSKQSRFTLFPTPPTPPHDVGRGRFRSKAITRQQSSVGTLPSLSETSPYTGCTSWEEQTQPSTPPVPPLLSIRPANLRKPKRLSNSSGSTTKTVPQTPPEAQIGSSRKHPETPSAKSKPSRTLFSWSPSWKNQQVVSQDHVRSETRSPWRNRKKSFGQLSQMIGAEDGEVDRRKLSVYLGNILDTSFEMPGLTDVMEPRPDPEQHRHITPVTSSLPISQKGPATQVRLNMSDEGECVCNSQSVICRCLSSPEFNTFRKLRNDHKPQASVSSTACLMGIPRARFIPVLSDIESPKPDAIPPESSPPGLSYSSSGSQATSCSEWSFPESPLAARDLFISRFDALRLEESPSLVGAQRVGRDEAMMNKRISDSQSFSRPFRAGKPPSMVSSRFSGSPTQSTRTSISSGVSQHAYLSSRETISTFDFDFDYQGSPPRRQAAGKEHETGSQLQNPSEQPYTEHATRPRTPPRRSSMKPGQHRWSSCSAETHSHKRSLSSTCSSLFEVIESANTAMVAQAKSAKAVVVMHRHARQSSTGIPQAKSEHWKRIEREQQEQLQKLQRMRQQQYKPRDSLRAGTKSRRSMRQSILAVRRDSVEATPKSQQQRYSKRVELGLGLNESGDYRANTSNGSPVTGRAQLVLLSS